MSKLVVLVGPPGSGKGTQGQLLAKKMNLLHVSVGDMCREMVAKQNALGKRIERYVKAGNFVPDQLIMQLVEMRLGRADVKGKTVLLDGFPRTVGQATLLKAKQTIKIDKFIVLQVQQR